MFSKRQRSLLRARSSLGTPCKQGPGCAGAAVSTSHAVEEFPWYLSPLVLRICACSPAAGQRIESTGDWMGRDFCVVHHRTRCEQAWCFPLGASKGNSSVLKQRASVMWLGGMRPPSGYVTQHAGSHAPMCRKRKSLQSHVNLGQNESVTAVISSSLAFLTKTYEYNIPLHWFPAEISIKDLYIAAL